MKLVLDKKHGNRVEFVAKGVATAFANLVRRYGMSRVPVLAIESVTFYDNSSAFWDEYIAHRLGLMPLLTPDKTPESAEIIFSLDAEGPKMVYASDMVSSDKDISAAKGTIPIVTLGQNQHLRFEAKAILGTARRHAKFQAGRNEHMDIGEPVFEQVGNQVAQQQSKSLCRYFQSAASPAEGNGWKQSDWLRSPDLCGNCLCIR